MDRCIVFITAIATFLLTSFAHGDSVVGYDYLGAAHPKFPAQAAIQLTPEGSAIGVFLDTFGDAVPVLEQLAQSGKFPIIRVQAHWDNSHAIVSEAKAKTDAIKVEKIAKKYPGIKWYLSPSCEHNGNAEQAKKRMAIVRQFAPSTIPVNSVWQGAILDGEINERHGSAGEGMSPGRYSTSFDGDNAPDTDLAAWHKQHNMPRNIFRMLWTNSFNGRAVYKPGESPPPPPSQRVDWPTTEHLKAIIALGTPPEICPVPIQKLRRATPINKPRLYKLFSENHPNQTDTREDRPVLIVDSNAAIAEVLTKDGDKIATFRNEGSFTTPGYFRYYSGTASNLWGFQIARKAKKQSGSTCVWFRVGNKTFGPAPAAFRLGYFLQ